LLSIAKQQKEEDKVISISEARQLVLISIYYHVKQNI